MAHEPALLKALQNYDPTQSIVVSKELAAYSQLATAIWLWFNYGDPVSIHTLAAASQGILENLAGKKHEFPHMRNWTKKFPRRVQKILRDPQNCFKHGWTERNKSLRYDPYIGDLIISDACLLHQDLIGLTSSIKAFTIRFSFERPRIVKPEELSEKITDGIVTNDLGSLARPAFFEMCLGRLNAAAVKAQQKPVDQSSRS
jgi:hypothetical protein